MSASVGLWIVSIAFIALTALVSILANREQEKFLPALAIALGLCSILMVCKAVEYDNHERKAAYLTTSGGE